MVYYSSIYAWKALLDFYAAFVRQIELGNRTWKNDPCYLEVPLLSKHVKQDFNKKNLHITSRRNSSISSVVLCRFSEEQMF